MLQGAKNSLVLIVNHTKHTADSLKVEILKKPIFFEHLFIAAKIDYTSVRNTSYITSERTTLWQSSVQSLWNLDRGNPHMASKLQTLVCYQNFTSLANGVYLKQSLIKPRWVMEIAPFAAVLYDIKQRPNVSATPFGQMGLKTG